MKLANPRVEVQIKFTIIYTRNGFTQHLNFNLPKIRAELLKVVFHLLTVASTRRRCFFTLILTVIFFFFSLPDAVYFMIFLLV